MNLGLITKVSLCLPRRPMKMMKRWDQAPMRTTVSSRLISDDAECANLPAQMPTIILTMTLTILPRRIRLERVFLMSILTLVCVLVINS